MNSNYYLYYYTKGNNGFYCNIKRENAWFVLKGMKIEKNRVAKELGYMKRLVRIYASMACWRASHRGPNAREDL